MTSRLYKQAHSPVLEKLLGVHVEVAAGAGGVTEPVDRAQIYTSRLEADLTAMRRLYDLQAKLAVETDLKTALCEIVVAASELTGTDRGCVQLVSDDGQHLEMYAHRGYDATSGFIAHFLHKGSKEACDAARERQQRTVISDVANHPALLDTDDRRIALAEDIRATQSTPMVSRKGNLVGVLSVQFRKPHESTEDELKLIDMLAWTAADFIDRHQTEAALRHANEARYRRALEIDTVPVVFYDFAGGISDANDAFLDMIGYTRSELDANQICNEVLTPPDWAWRDEQTLAELKATGRSKPFEKQYFRRDGSRIWIHCAGRMIDEHTAVEFIIDLTDLRNLQSRQEVLVAELQHRTRNLITVVRALARKTVAEATSLTDFTELFNARLEALARVQGLLSQLSTGERITFDQLLRAEIGALGMVANERDKVTLDGPNGVPLRSATVQIFALALHELATNSVKYGALSAKEGHLNIMWRVIVDEKRGQSWLNVDWRESGVEMPKIDSTSPTMGYGRELIERALPYQLQAKTSFELSADGVRCTISLPISSGPNGKSQA